MEEAVLDVELFGHATAPDRLLDGTVRHPAAGHIIAAAGQELGAAAKEGVACKEGRYPATSGKHVIPCAAETWGYIDGKLDDLLAELSVLASQRQRDRGQLPSRWASRWRTQISLGIAMSVGRALLSAAPTQFKPMCVLRVVHPGRRCGTS